MTKQEARKACLKKRAGLLNRAAMDANIHLRLFSQDFYKKAQTVMLYLSYQSEPDTHALAKQMLSCGKILCAPVCVANGRMESYGFSHLSQLSLSPMGILEPPKENLVLPQQLDLIIVPGCGFSAQGHRLGYGGGYYDRFLAKTNAVTCGLFYEALQTDFVPEETDIPLQYIITEKTLYHFK